MSARGKTPSPAAPAPCPHSWLRLKLGARLSSWNKAHGESSNPQEMPPVAGEGLALARTPSVPPLPRKVSPGQSSSSASFLPRGRGRERGREQVVGSCSGSAASLLCDHRQAACPLWASTDETRGMVQADALSPSLDPQGRSAPAGSPPSTLTGPREESTQRCSGRRAPELALSPGPAFLTRMLRMKSCSSPGLSAPELRSPGRVTSSPGLSVLCV